MMRLERSPPRIGPDVLDAQPVGVLPNASLLQRRDPKQRFFSASQLLKLGRCNDQLNPPHHLRLVGRPTMPVRAIRRVERVEIKLLDRIEHEPREMIRREPIPQRGRHQECLLTIAFDEVLGHSGIPPDGPDGTVCATATA